jgi:hypothetical protein
MGMYDDFKGMLGDHLPNWLPEDPNKNAAARQGLLALGATMMGARGNLGESLSQGLLAGAGGYNGAMAQQGQQQLREAQMQQTKLETQGLQAKIDRPMNLARIAAGVRGGQSSVAPVSALPQIGQTRAPSASPMGGGYGGGPPNTAPSMPQQVAQPAAPTQGGTDYQAQIMLAKAYYDGGYPDEAKDALAAAEKMRPKIKEQRVLTIDGQRVMANVFEDGRTERVDGFSPDAEKLSFQNTGGATVALDPFTGKPVNTIQNTQSPESIASNATARRGQDIGHGDSVAGRALQERTAAQGRTPVGYRWAADGKGLEAIPGGPVMAKTTEQQQKVNDATSVLGLLDMAEGLVGKGTSSYAGNLLDQAGRLVGVSSSGGEAAGQLKAIEGSLVSKMPKMTGPQSDKDVLLYKQMAGQIGDPTIPVPIKKAAMGVVREINVRYLDQVGAKKVTPLSEVKKVAPAAGYQDTDKEARYQAWKRSQAK